MLSWDVPLVLRLGLLGAYLLLLGLRYRNAVSSRVYTAALGVLAGLGLVAYTHFIVFDTDTGSLRLDRYRVQVFHAHDIYHYYVAPKFFSEVGYSGLYEATVIADYEDDPARFQADRYIRDLESNADLKQRRAVVREAERIKAPFSPERWREFKQDIGFFRALNPAYWHSSEVTGDHGYNGTPLTTAVLGLIANHKPGSTAAFIGFIKWLDLYLLFFVVALIRRFQGWNPALTFLFFWLVNPFNESDVVGQSYLRYNYFFTLALAILFFEARKPVLSGACFALSSLFRIFPAFFFAALVAYPLANPKRRSALEQNRRLYVSFLLTLFLTLGATSFVSTPDERVGWLAFYERMGARRPFSALNVIGLQYPFGYSHETHLATTQRLAEVDGEPTVELNHYWNEEVPKTFERRKGWYAASAALLLALAIPYARRIGSEPEALFLGLLMTFVLVFIGQYYYCILSLIPLIFREDRRIWIALVVLWVVCTLAYATQELRDNGDLQYVVINVLVLLFLITVLALKISRPSGARAGRTRHLEGHRHGGEDGDERAAEGGVP